MSELFRINKKGDAVLDPDAVKLTVHLQKVSQPQLLFIIRAYDYKGPYHQFPKADRIRKAKRHTWNTDDIDPSLGDAKFDLAVEEYMGLQYDTTREMRDTLLSKLSDIQVEIAAEKDPVRLEKLYKVLTSTNALIKSLQKEIDVAEQVQEELKGDRVISTIEKYQLRLNQQKKDTRVAKQREGSFDASA